MSDGRLTIYIATWGNPLTWSLTRYKCPEERESISSIVCAEADVKVVYVVDSVITASLTPQQKPNDCVVKCAKSTGGLEWTGSKLHPRDGVRWRETAESYVKCVLRNVVEVDAEVAVGPSKGSYAEWKYEAYRDVVAAGMLLSLWEVIGRRAEGVEGKVVSINLDVTHGVNFMPTLAMAVSRLLASLLLARGASRVNIAVYNAVPGSWEFTKIYSETHTYLYFPSEPKAKAARALYYGALVQFAELCKEHGEDEERLQVEPVIDWEKKTVKYPDASLADVYEKLLIREACKGAETRLKALMRWHIRDKLPPSTSALVTKELNDIYNAAEKLQKGLYDAAKKLEEGQQLYLAELLKQYGEPTSQTGGGSANCNCENQNVRRNFIAHGGLLKDCVKIRRCGDDFCLDATETHGCLGG